jgi:hypothetical protein
MRAGMPMFLHEPERVFPQLGRWLARLRFDLGLPPQGRALCSTHATRGGTSTAMHSDHAVSFILQMSGTKVWHIADNRAFPLPTQRHSLVMDTVHGELAGYQVGPVPTAILDDAQTITLGPGSLLFVPSGWWHAVDGPDESLALMFIAINVNWAVVVARALQRALTRDRRWRPFAVGARSPNAAMRARARATAAELLDDLRARLSRMTPDDLLAPSYWRSQRAHRAIEGAVVTIDSAPGRTRLELGDAELRAFTAIDARRGGFTGDELVADGHDPDVVDVLLAALTEAGFLQLDP